MDSHNPGDLITFVTPWDDDETYEEALSYIISTLENEVLALSADTIVYEPELVVVKHGSATLETRVCDLSGYPYSDRIEATD